MKHLQKLRLLTLILLGLLIYSCDYEDNISSETEQLKTHVDTSKLIDFKGLAVNHRFSTPIEALTEEHTETVLKKMYRKARKATAQKKGIAFKGEVDDLPDAETIIEGSKNVIEQFPYGKIEEELEEEVIKEKDTIPLEVKNQLITDGLLEEEEEDILTEDPTYVAQGQAEAETNWEMIKNDFPTLNETQIEENIELIDDYYAQNLNYVVLDEIANNQEEIANKVAQKRAKKSKKSQSNKGEIKRLTCILWNYQSPWNFITPHLFSRYTGRFSYTLSTIAIGLALDRAKTSSTNYYGHLAESNSRRDTYRHILMSSLLAQYYYTVSSKHKRIKFAEAVGYANEVCGENPVDGREMDYHNNAIGRKIWNENTRYRKIWRWTVGLRKPSTSTLKRIARDYVNNKSCYIVKKVGEKLPENRLTRNYTDAEIRQKILNTDANTPVYFEGPIRTTNRYLPSTQYDYSDCGSNDLPWSEQRTFNWWRYSFRYTWYSPCVRRTVPACYKL